MNAKMLVPWALVVGLGVGLGALFMTNQKQAAELTQLRNDHQQLEDLRASLDETKKTQAASENDELNRLREDNKDLLRLRSEIQRLRGENGQLTKRAQTAEQQMQSAQSQAQNAQAQAQNFQQQAQTAQAQAAALRLNAAPEARTGVCINNLRQIDAAKQQWAQANGRPPDAIPGPAEISAYLPNRGMPVCPGGGGYSINAVNVKPACSVPGHVLQ
jgi:DNA repair exonuclease SbcCD ATPase subunit